MRSLIFLGVVVFAVVQFHDALSAACKATANCRQLNCTENEGSKPRCNQGFCMCDRPGCVDECTAAVDRTECVYGCQYSFEAQTCVAKCSADCATAALAKCATKNSTVACDSQAKKPDQFFASCRAVKGAPTCSQSTKHVCGNGACACMDDKCLTDLCTAFMEVCAMGCAINPTLVLKAASALNANGTLKLQLPDTIPCLKPNHSN